MKAGIYLGKEKIELQELSLPEVGDKDMLVQNINSSVCGTNVAVFMHGPNTGHKVNVGGEFGHETISRVVKVGKNIKDFTIGERVYPYSGYAKDDTRRAGTIGGFIFDSIPRIILAPIDLLIIVASGCITALIFTVLKCNGPKSIA